MLALQVILKTPEPDPATMMAEHSISVLHGVDSGIQVYSDKVEWIKKKSV